MSTDSLPDDTCPFCKTYINDSARVAEAIKEFNRELDRKIRNISREKEEEYRAVSRALKEAHRKELQKTRALGKSREIQLREKLTSAAKKDKVANKAALARVKKNYQEQLWSMKELYERENLKMQKESESASNAQLKEIVQNYGILATGHQKEMERVKRAHEQLDSEMRKKDSELTTLKIDLARSTSALEVKELMIQLNDRNATIERLGARVRELENKIGLEQRTITNSTKESARTMTDDEQREKLKEYMRAIIEITRSQQPEKKPAAKKSDEKLEQEAGESKVDRLLGWFF